MAAAKKPAKKVAKSSRKAVKKPAKKIVKKRLLRRCGHPRARRRHRSQGKSAKFARKGATAKPSKVARTTTPVAKGKAPEGCETVRTGERGAVWQAAWWQTSS